MKKSGINLKTDSIEQDLENLGKSGLLQTNKQSKAKFGSKDFP